MNEKTLNIFILQLAILGITEGIFQVQNFLPRCSYKCDEPKKGDTNNKKIKDIYWRDFHGFVPPDAYPFGDNQNPQTYIGMVFDPSHNGTFLTTIVEGQDFVYSVLGNQVTKLTDTIQILCTMEPEKLTWIQLYNVDQLGDNHYAVSGFFHHEKNKDTGRLEHFTHYVAKTTEGNMAYAGYSTGLNTSMTYALRNGTPRMTRNFEWLIFAKDAEGVKESSSNPFFSFNYNFGLNPGLFQSKFHHQINIGSCSLVCTNQGKVSTDKDEIIKKKSERAMVYYWKDHNLEDREDVLEVGRSFSDKPLYIGQALTYSNWLDVGQSEGETVFIVQNKYTEVQIEFQLLASVYQERLEWINTTTQTFDQLDRTKLVPGGKLDNGTHTYVGRSYYVDEYKPGSVRVSPTGTYCVLLYETVEQFQVLSVKDKTS